MQKSYLAHYHEIGIKGGNRWMFENQLRQNIQQITGIAANHIRLSSGRFIIEKTTEKIVSKNDGRLNSTQTNYLSEDNLSKKLSQVFGISSFSPAIIVKPQIADIKEAVLKLADEKKFTSFAVCASRGDKKFPLTSMEINKETGAIIQQKTKAKVNLDKPKQTFWIEITPKEAIIYTEKIFGPGGLPVGSQGRVLALLSGGIDSPVAAHQILKRGASVDFIHFHSHPFTSKASIEKVKELAGILNQYAMKARLFLAPFAEIQKEIVQKTEPRLRIVLYRRMMLRLAEAVAKKENALALVTGDSLGQVASQTLENMTVIQQAVTIPILRPLVGFDKEEIITLARKIGTYETSILPHDDCCTVFLPKHPTTRARLDEVLEAEKTMDIPKTIAKTIKQVELDGQS